MRAPPTKSRVSFVHRQSALFALAIVEYFTILPERGLVRDPDESVHLFFLLLLVVFLLVHHLHQTLRPAHRGELGELTRNDDQGDDDGDYGGDATARSDHLERLTDAGEG